MKRQALIFLVAIFLPSFVLGWIALRAAGKQRILIERQAADLHQAETDSIASSVRDAVESKQRAFAESIRALVAKDTPSAVAENYGQLLAGVWTEGGVPFAISPRGALAYPSNVQARGAHQVETFLGNNAAFLTNARAEEVYQQVPQDKIESKLAQSSSYFDRSAGAQAVPQSKAALSKEAFTRKSESQGAQLNNRNIVPQNDAQAAAPSKLVSGFSDFQTALGGAAQGILARFVQNDLQVIFWTKPDPASNWLFGVALGPEELARLVRLPENTDPDTVLAILDDRARPVATAPGGAKCEWKRPFVATEIGEVLPHWEVALYLLNPGQLTESARLVTATLTLLIALALAAILVGAYLVAVDTRRQLDLARKKTDFVSNVSHELKTPLTSIRMFAELLADNRVSDPGKRSRYLRIIAGESERLTRLVNNVLDFARLEKKHKSYDMRPADLVPLADRVCESESVRLQEAGFQVGFSCELASCPVRCDADAIAQVLVNLLSNAEKYGNGGNEVNVVVESEPGPPPIARISVLDRGTGVRAGLEEKIFEAFFRADDSLASGVQGSGLGLTLARRIARDHGGDIRCHQRPGGGSIFTLSLPLLNEPFS
ncbi:MAG: HAMP domain-containing sensor histidine kinase [Verrucomicrobiota bacterium]